MELALAVRLVQRFCGGKKAWEAFRSVSPGYGDPHASNQVERLLMFLFTFLQARRAVHQNLDLNDLWDPFTPARIRWTDKESPSRTVEEIATSEGSGAVRVPGRIPENFNFHHNAPFTWVRQCGHGPNN
jgi:hypothetical protein